MKEPTQSCRVEQRITLLKMSHQCILSFRLHLKMNLKCVRQISVPGQL